MNTEKYVNQIPLSHSQTLYMMVDGTQVNDIAKSLYEIAGELIIEPIYLYEPHNTLISVSPYLVVVTNNVKKWFAKQNNPLIGYFFTSPLSFDELASAFRHFIKVTTPYDSSVYFKFANSESAYVLLSTEDMSFWSLFDQVWLTTRHGYYDFIRPKHLQDMSFDRPLKLTDRQWELLGDIVWRNTLDSIKIHITKWFPSIANTSLRDSSWLEKWAGFAYKKGFTSERALLMFFNVIGFTSEEVILNPKINRDIYTLVNSTSEQTPIQRIEKAAFIAEKYYQKRIGDR